MPRGNRNYLSASWLASVLVLATAVVSGYKLWSTGCSLGDIMPSLAYDVRTRISFEGHDDAVRIQTYLPPDNPRQRIRLESLIAADLHAVESPQGDNRLITWSSPAIRGPRTISASYRVRGSAVKFLLPEDLPIDGAVPEQLRSFLESTPTIQVDADEIGALLDRLAPEPRTVAETLAAIFAYTHRELERIPFKGTTDALTALRLAQGSCNGKSRLFAALARRAGLPTRLIGGLILTSGRKRPSHQWVETWVNGVWVPFCPLNGHFAEMPAHYLRLYTGDEVLFRHTSNINFDYDFDVRRRFVAGSTLEDGSDPLPWSSYRLWETLRGIGVPMDLLRVLLLLPLAATVTVILRNVVGMRVFGTFLPALIAVACRETGLWLGLAGFALLLAAVGAARAALSRMNLLHTPKLAVMLTVVIVGMVALSLLGVGGGWGDLAYISLFPIAITTLTAERFATMVQEEGWRVACLVTAQTAIAVSACYLFIESLALQSVFLAFPELLLAVIAIDLWLGRWMGLRLVEYGRFRALLGRGRA